MDSKIKAVCSRHKGAVTKLLIKFEEIRQNSDFESDEISTLLETLTHKREILVELNEKVLNLTSDEEVATEIKETDEYMFTVDTKLKQIRKCMLSQPSTQSTSNLNPLTNSFAPNTCNPSRNIMPDLSHETIVENQRQSAINDHANSNSQIQSTSNMFNHSFTSASSTSSQNHRLPKLDLPYFDGDILHWQTFWDSFESTIHHNANLTEIQKFSYLKAQLRSVAAKSIEGFPLTNANYDTAVELLRQRFGQSHKIIHAYMKALMELSAPSCELHSLRNYGEKLEAYVRGLNSLGQTQDMYGALLVPVVIGKLPAEIRKSIARENGTDNLTLNDIRKAISKEINILEVGCTTDISENKATVTFFTGTKSRNQKVNLTKTTRKRSCVFCDEARPAIECTKVKDTDTKIAIVKRKKLCFNCLGFHWAKDCKSQNKCQKCNHKHHTSLCGGRFVNSEVQGTTQKKTVNVVHAEDNNNE